MNKNELLSGMIIETRNGNVGLVLKCPVNGDRVVADGSANKIWGSLTSWNDDLTSPDQPFFDIVKVYDVDGRNQNQCSLDLYAIKGRTIKWTRE